MAAPTFVIAAQTAWNTTTSPKTTTIAVQVGDILVAHCVAEGGRTGMTLPVSDSSSHTWTKQQESGAGITNQAYVATYTTTATVATTLTVTVTRSGGTSVQFGMLVEAWRSASLGTSATANNGAGSGAPSITLTTTAANSALSAAVGDWNTVSGTGVWTTTAGTPTTDVDTVTTNYAIHIAHYGDVGAAGSKTIGMSSPSTQRYGINAIEIKGPATTGTTGTLAATEGADAASASGVVQWSGTLAATEGADLASASGVSGTASGPLAATEGADSSTGSGLVQWTAALAATEGADASALSGLVQWAAGLAATEGADVSTANGSVQWAAMLAATEGADAAAAAGLVIVTGTIAATEGADSAVLTGGGVLAGDVTATEGADLFSASGSVIYPPLSGILDATEGADLALFASAAAVLYGVGGDEVVVLELARSVSDLGARVAART